MGAPPRLLLLAAVALLLACAAGPRSGGVQEPTGGPASRLVAVVRGPRGPLLAAHDLAFSPDTGRLFVADAGDGRVLHFDAAGRYTGEFGRRGGGFVRFRSLAGIDVGEGDSVLCVDQGRGAVLAVDPDAGAVRSQEERAGPDRTGEWIADVAATAEGGFFLLGCRDRLRFVLTPSGRSVPLPAAIEMTGGMCPGVLASDRRGGFYHVDDSSDRVDHLEAGEGAIRSFHLRRIRPGGFPVARSVAVAAAGLVLVADAGQGVVQTFDRQGDFRGVLQDEEGKPLRYADPGSVAADGGRRVAVIDRGTGLIDLRELLGETLPADY